MGCTTPFLDHKAWPTDITEKEQNVLHRACSVFTARRGPNNRAHLFIQLLATLVSMGVPINGSARIGTPLWWFLSYRSQKSEYIDEYVEGSGLIARELILQDAVYEGEHDDGWVSSWILPGLFPSLGDTLHCFDYGELSSALIRRSEADVRRLLSQSRDHVLERGHHRHTPLHLSVCWPLGLRILFELANDTCVSIIDATDSAGLTPLKYAINWSQFESVAILLEHNSAINLEDISSYAPRFVKRTKPEDKKICDLLAATLVARRTDMLQYALKHLPESEVAGFDLRKMSFLKENAYEVGQSLKSKTACLPASFKDVGPGSIYHQPFMGDLLAEALFEVGFESVDLRWNDCTPLMIQRWHHLGYAVRGINWFCQKQADLLAVMTGTLLLSSADPPPGPL
ncbi:Ankyrin repeat protein [Colletotrichum asianum]